LQKLIVRGESSEPQRNNFDALRLGLAVLVVWSHSFALHLGSERTEWLSLLLNGTYNAGNLAVMAFFIISGFLITQSYERSRSVRSYCGKRIRRIYPGYMVATTICAFIVIPVFAQNVRIDAAEVGKTFALNLLLQGHFVTANAFPMNSGHGVNGSLWSIFYEFWCYIGVALLGALGLTSRRSFLVPFLVAVMLARVGCDLLGKTPGYPVFDTIFGWPYLWTKMLPCFLLGMVAYSYRQVLPQSLPLLTGLLFTAIAASWINKHLADLIVAPALSYGVFYFAFTDEIRLHEAARFGDFSYGTYLYAFPIQQMLQATVGRSWTMPTFIAVSIVLSLLAAVLSWHLVERWFLPRRVAARASPPIHKGVVAAPILAASPASLIVATTDDAGG